MSYFESVREFHEVYGLDINDAPIDISSENWRIWALRSHLHNEEFQELRSAMIRGDTVAIADALCDLIYVLCGTAVSFGIPLDECFAEVQRSNMSKLGKDGKPIVREDGKILKGPNYSPPDLRSIIHKEEGNAS